MASEPKISILTSLFRSESYLASFLEAVEKQSIYPNCELVLVLNEGSKQEKRIIKQFQSRAVCQSQVLLVDKVESLGASWNRAWKAAKAPFLAIWNVDDQRTNTSLEMQINALETNSDWVLSYGDYVRVGEYGAEAGKMRQTPAYSARHFRRAFPQGGAFWVMRNGIEEQMGYFDEQFQVGPDLDMSFRIAEAGLKMGRVESNMGFFTDVEVGLSTRDGARKSAIERTAIQERFGVYDKIRGEYQDEAQGYRIKDILNFGKWIALERYLPGHGESLKKREYLRSLGRLREGLRKILGRIGILEWLHRIQDKVIGREL